MRVSIINVRNSGEKIRITTQEEMENFCKKHKYYFVGDEPQKPNESRYEFIAITEKGILVIIALVVLTNKKENFPSESVDFVNEILLIGCNYNLANISSRGKLTVCAKIDCEINPVDAEVKVLRCMQRGEVK